MPLGQCKAAPLWVPAGKLDGDVSIHCIVREELSGVEGFDPKGDSHNLLPSHTRLGP
jgi:hypothetical protein